MAKLRLDDFFKKTTTSNFKTAEQFFENYNNGFLPANTLSHPETDRSSIPLQPKFKVHKLQHHSSKQEEDTLRGSFRSRKPTLKETFYIFCEDKEPSIINTRTVLPSARSHRSSPLDITRRKQRLGGQDQYNIERAAKPSLDKGGSNGFVRRERSRVRKVP